jgi:5-formyltetrahydrofolate cyclo-ligase
MLSGVARGSGGAAPGTGRGRRHDHDAGGAPEVLAAKAELRAQVWAAMGTAKVARFPGAVGRIPNFTGAERAAQRLRETAAWQRAGRLKANPDAAQWPVRQRALEDGKLLLMAVPRLAEPDPFLLLDPEQLADPPRKASTIKGATRSARRVPVDAIGALDLVVVGCVAAGTDGARLGKGGGFADLELAVASEAGLVGPDTVLATTVHELQVRAPGEVPTTGHDVPLDLIITPDRVIDCRAGCGPRPPAGIHWPELTAEKIAAIPLLARLRRDGAAHREG